MFEGEGSPESSIESTSVESTPESAPEADSGGESAPALAQEAEKVAQSKPEPESLRAKMEKKMAIAKANDIAAGIVKKDDLEPRIPPASPGKDPKTGKFLAKPGETPAVEAPKYEANLKFKFTDGTAQQQEKEFPDWAKAGIKDAESEKEIRSVFEKAHGLDFVLPRFKATREELQAVKPQLETYQKNVAGLRDMYQKGNMAGIFEKLGMSEEKVLQYAVERAKFYQLPPEQQNLIKSQQDAERNVQSAQENAQQTQERYDEQARQIKQLQLTTVLQRPDVSAAEQAFDTKMGKKGAFFEQVKLMGEMTWHRSQGKIDLTPEQAITEVMKQYGLTGAQAAAATPAAPTPAAQAAAPAQAAYQAPPVKVIPNVGSRSASPAATQHRPRSIEDLKKIAKNMNG